MILNGETSLLHVDPDFPVSEPGFNTRNETPPIRPHIHNLCEVGYCFDGAGIFLVDNKVLPFKCGDAVFINAREVHWAKSNPGQTTSWGFLNFDPAGLLARHLDDLHLSFITDCCCGDRFCNIFDGRQLPEITGNIRMLLAECRDRPPDWRSMVRARVWQLIVQLKRLMPESGSESCGSYETFRRIIPALDFMNAHFGDEITLEHLARLCGTSIPNFRKLFCKALGCAPQPYLKKIRLQSACSMLKSTDRTIGQIAFLCGFNHISNFNRQFLACYGMPPSVYRSRTGGME